jgi:O-antigen/teichoic acid export membrane protein
MLRRILRCSCCFDTNGKVAPIQFVALNSSATSISTQVDEKEYRRDTFFATDFKVDEIQAQSVRGGAVTLSAQVVKFLLGAASTMVLARLLTPADYGLVGMVSAVVGFVAMFKDAGFSMATVQREKISHEQVSTLFWINFGLSFLLMLVLVVLAPAIADFYSEPKLVWITLAFAGSFLFGGLTVQHQALLRRRMQFKALAGIDVASLGFGITIGIAAALMGFRYWALVFMNVAVAFSYAAGVWLMMPWRPGLPRRQADVRSMLSFGGNMMGFGLVTYFARNADCVLLGWYWGPTIVGLYQRAYALLMLPINQVNGPLVGVAIPALSRLVNQPRDYAHCFLRALGLVFSFTIPVVLFTAVFADELILVMLGSGWREAASIFRLLAPAALAGALMNPLGWLFVSLGRTDRFFRLGLVYSVLTVLAFVVGLPWGAQGVAACYSLVTTITMLPLFAQGIKDTAIRLIDIGRIVKAPLMAAFIASLLGLFFKSWAEPSIGPVLRLVLGGSLAAGIYAFTLLGPMKQWPLYRGIVEQLWVRMSAKGSMQQM